MCVDVDECSFGNHENDGTSLDSRSDASSGDGGSEDAHPMPVCSEGFSCINTLGSFTCEKVTTESTTTAQTPGRNSGNSNVGNQCGVGFEVNDYGDCIDSDECQTNNGECESMCMNYYGTRRCYEDMSVENSIRDS